MRTVRFAFLVTILSMPAWAQELPAPAEQLDRYAPMAGRWEGKGVFRMGPDQPEMPWTSVSTVKKVMGGHFYEENMRVELGEMGAMGFISFYAYDAHLGHYHSVTVNNQGALETARIHWTDENTMMTMSTPVQDGQPVLNRWTTTVKDGRLEMVGETAMSGSPMFVHVKGTSMKKDGPAPDMNIPSMMGMPASEEMTTLARMAGRFTMKGSYRMGPDQEMVPFTGTDHIRPIFGGLVLASQSQGDGYEGRAYFVWNGEKKAYATVEVNNWGMCHTAEGWIMENSFVSNTSAIFMGTPMVTRHVIQLNDKGQPTACDGHMMQGGAAPFHSMTCTYARATATGN